MRFYVAGAETEQETRLIYEHLRQTAQTLAGNPTDRRIYDLLYSRMDKFYRLTVGKPHPINGEILIGIIETAVGYAVFTLNRGVIRGEPYMVALSEVLYIEEFAD